jgi:hypothetical protein
MQNGFLSFIFSFLSQRLEAEPLFAAGIIEPAPAVTRLRV